MPVSVVARKLGMAKSLLFRWRKEAGFSGKRRQAGDPRGSRCVAGFVPVQITASPAVSLAPPPVPTPVRHAVALEPCRIEIELVGGIKLRVSGTVKPEALRQVIAALEVR